MVDATIVHAPSLTKIATGKRDPEMHQTQKGKQWSFGMKVHTRRPMPIAPWCTPRSRHARQRP